LARHPGDQEGLSWHLKNKKELFIVNQYISKLSIILSIFCLAISNPVYSLTANEITKLLAPDGADGDNFGASISIESTAMAIGAIRDDDNGVDTGSVYIFNKDANGNWLQTAKLNASDSTADDRFGVHVLLDGDRLFVGSLSDNGTNDDGAVYIFNREISGTWTESAKLTPPPDSNTGINTGFSTALSVENNTLLVGSSHDDAAGNNAGAVFVFQSDAAGNWSHQSTILPPPNSTRFFGKAVSLEGDIALIGASWDDDLAQRSGAAFIYERDTNGNWTYSQKLLANDGMADDNFGENASIRNEIAVISSPYNDEIATNAGAVYVFEKDSSGTWTQSAKIQASNGIASEFFGTSIAFDGNIMVIGATGHDSSNVDGSGSAYIYRLSTIGSWSHELTLVPSDAAQNDSYGTAVALDDSGTIAVGSTKVKDSNGNQVGAAVVFEHDEQDTDGDGIVDTADNCPAIINPDQADNDLDGVGDICDEDDDNDSIVDLVDNCVFSANTDQQDTDADGIGDVCDGDLDGDTVVNGIDNCPLDPNTDQTDSDGDLEGDACDIDDDNDTIVDTAPDNCPTTPNTDQSDLDNDFIGDACDTDIDGDGVLNTADNCPVDINSDQLDTDLDTTGNACDTDDDNDGVIDSNDNCPITPNTSQLDTDGDGIGDACDESSVLDSDNDGIDDEADNCPFIANTDQTDTDGDSEGDACDADDDNDSIVDSADLCPASPPGENVDAGTGCTLSQLCPCQGARESTEPWRNHGMYVSCVAKTTKVFVAQGLITETEKGDIVSAAAESSCGSNK
jgi:hypothetical protein